MPNYDEFRRRLQVSKHHLDDELEVHADILEQIGSECVRLDARELELKNELARVEARLTEEFKEDEPKLTKDQVEAKVLRSRERTQAWQAYQEARTEHQRWERLYEAWKARDFAVRKLADLFANQYFATDSVTRREPRRDREELPQRRRLSS